MTEDLIEQRMHGSEAQRPDLGDKLSAKQVVVLGLARQGRALARFLAESGARVIVSDLRRKDELADALDELSDLAIDYVLGKHPYRLLDGTDLLCLSGGVPPDIPLVIRARERGVPLSNDAQLFLERCPARVVGITGSAGKTTTTTLVGEMCRAAGFTTWVGGNIGNPLIGDLKDIVGGDRVVLELSSFQLELMTSSPHVAAVLNITPNHLDRHGSMEAYIAAKRNIVAYQGADDYAVLGYDDANARALAVETPAHLLCFSGGAEVDEGAFKTNGDLVLRLRGRTERICGVSDVRLRGYHNVLNVLAACTIAGLVGVPMRAMQEIVTTFAGVEHRLERVRDLAGVAWYDDSIATAPERSVAALRSFEEPLILLAGGRDKDLPWEPFAHEVVTRVRLLVTFGEAGGMIARRVRAARRDGPEGPPARLETIVETEALEEAVVQAHRLAQPGDVVLLSPGGTSFDAFRDFAERGERFKELVRAL